MTNSKLVVLWESFASPGKIIFDGKNVTAGSSGANFSGQVQLNANSSDASSPDITIDGKEVYAVWVDKPITNDTAATTEELMPSQENASDREQTSNYASEIVLRKSNNAGISFEPYKNISLTPGSRSFDPAVASSGSNVYVAWADTAAAYQAEEKHSDIFYSLSSRMTENPSHVVVC